MKRGKCPCGGYYQDWHSHASDCIELGGDVDYGINECPMCGCEINKDTEVCPDPECRFLLKFAEKIGYNEYKKFEKRTEERIEKWKV